MIYLIISLYFICSYFLTRFVHRNLEELPNLVTGIISILLLPLSIMVCCVALLNDKNIVNKIFGKPV